MKDYKNPIYATMKMARANLSRIADNIYQQGYEAGKAATPFTDTEEAEKKAYERGLNEAWEAARKLVHPRLGGYTEEQKQRIFGTYVSSGSILHNFTAPEVIAKIKACEDKQKQDAKIKVGDEVTTIYGSKGIVITDEPSAVGDISVWLSTCTHVQLYPKDKLTRTGRTFPEIAEVLAKLRGAENDK